MTTIRDHIIALSARAAGLLIFAGLTLAAPAAAAPKLTVSFIAPTGVYQGVAFTGPIATFSTTVPRASAAAFRATIRWGDGASSPGTVAAAEAPSSFRITGSHTYSLTGTFHASVSITGKGGKGTAAGVIGVKDAPLNVQGRSLGPSLELKDDENFIVAMYQDLLGRQPTDVDLSSSLAFLAQQGTRPALVTQVVGATEFRSLLIQGFYAVYLHRSADPGGLSSLLAALNGGAKVEQVQSVILGSPEYFTLHGHTNAAFLGALYQDVLGRPADTTAQTIFLPLLAGGAARSDVANTVLTSVERFQNLIQLYYKSYLMRSADAGGASTFLSLLQSPAGTDAQVMSILLGSDEYYARVTTSLVATSQFNGVVGGFTDPNLSRPSSSYAATIDWGDGATDPATIMRDGRGGYTAAGTHVWKSYGTYTVTLTVTVGGAAGPSYTAATSALVLPARGPAR